MCKNSSCEAHNKMVIINLGAPVLYHLGMPSQDTNCPICKTYVDPKTCAFNNCKWRYFGIKKDTTGLKRVKCDFQSADNNYYRFDPTDHGMAQWTQLALECTFIDEVNKNKFNKCDEKVLNESKNVIERFKVKI